MDRIGTKTPTPNGIEWLKDKDLREPGITDEIRGMLDAAVTWVAEDALPIEVKVRLGVYSKQMTTAQLLEEFDKKYIDRSETRQDELRAVASKIKMRKNRTILDYVTKHRILRNDMIDAGCPEILHDTTEKMTIYYILKGLRGLPDWAPFCTAYRMFTRNDQNHSIDEIEKLLLEVEKDLKTHEEDE